MSTLQKPFELAYHGPGNTVSAKCGVEIFPGAAGSKIAIVSELPDNGGCSITNAAEIIASLLCERLALDPTKLTYIEHYPTHADGDPVPTWDLVTFKARRIGKRHASDRMHYELVDADWRPIARADIAELGLGDFRPYAHEIQELEAVFPATGCEGVWRVHVIDKPHTLAGGETVREPVAWFSDHPWMHGTRAHELAERWLKACYIARRDGKPEPVVGFEAQEWARVGFIDQGSEPGEFFPGVAELVSFNDDPTIGNPYRIKILKIDGGRLKPGNEVHVSRIRLSPL